jgi:hypothetical protein
MKLKHFCSALLFSLLALPAFSQDLLITAIFDGTLSGGNPRGLELYVVNDIPDLSLYGLGLSSNGGGSNGADYTFPADSYTAGDFIYIAKDQTAFETYFGGTSPNYTAGFLNFNGDDAMELFFNGAVIDIFGDINVDGTGTPWQYEDGYGYRNSGTSASTTWNAADWAVFTQIYDGAGTNGDASTPMPIGTYTPPAGGSFDCPVISANFGDTCDDGDASTFNDVVLGDCTCAGTPYDCVVLLANIGDACDDGDANTINDEVQADCTCAGTGISLSNALLISAIYDGPLTGGVPKGIELTALASIADLSIFGIASATNGGASPGVEFNLPSIALNSGESIFVSSDDTGAQQFFASTNTNVNGGSQMSINGDDVIELYENGILIDVYGEVGVDGTGTAWEYLDTYASRNCEQGPSSTFDVAEWTVGALNNFDGTSLNTEASEVMPVGGYQSVCSSQVFGCTDNTACNYNDLATDDDGNCTYPGDPCDDADGTTENDVLQGDCSCAGTAINFCPPVVWTAVDKITNSGSTGGSWEAITDGFAVNGFCGGGCQEAVETYIVSNGYDFSSVVAGNLIFDGAENFGTTDVVLQYTTAYNGDPAASTWIVLETITSAGAYSVDLSALAGQTEIYFAFLYNDDGADGYSSWTFTNISLTGDCPAPLSTFDCPLLSANIGDACDDADAATFNDLVLGDCSCAGTPYECPTLNLNIGDACDDADPTTINDTVQGDCTCAGTTPSLEQALIITAIYDGGLSGGLPKGIELYAIDDIDDLSNYGVGSASNGGGSPGVEYTFPADDITAGTFLFVSSDDLQAQAFFESGTTNYDAGSALSINGDDAVELYEFGQVIDVYGEVDVDGTGEAWEYLDGWAVRKCATGPDGATFTPGNWTFGGINQFDGFSLNSEATNPMPVGAYAEVCPVFVPGCTNDLACNYDITATDDDGSCILPGDACDDGNAATENDQIQADCSCAGTAVVTCAPIIFTAVDVLTNSGNTGGSWQTITDGFSVNGFCGGGCVEAVDTWIVSDAYDFSAILATNLIYNVSENFGSSTVLVQYSTDYAGDPSLATWTSLNSFDAAGGYTVDLSVLSGVSSAVIGFQYEDDATDGFSGFEVRDINFTGDCPANTVVYDCPALQLNFGDACDDGDVTTIDDQIQGDCSCAGTPTVLTNSLIITAVYDGPLSGGVPKGVELYATADIADLSTFAIGSANNGGGTDGPEFTFPADAVTAGSFIYVSSNDTSAVQYFELTAAHYNAGSVLSINGDDALELFEFGQVIDTYGQIDVDGSGTAWEYTDGWATRNCAVPAAGGTFTESDWTFAPGQLAGALNSEATTPMPLAAYLETCVSDVEGCTNDQACNYDATATIDDGSCLLPVADCSQCNGAVLEIIDTDGDGICDADEVTCPEDINRDGIVDVNDFLMLASVFGQTCN